MAHQLKVKIFRSKDFTSRSIDFIKFEESVNDWLAENTKDGKCVILNILQSECEKNTTISIFYNEYVKE